MRLGRPLLPAGDGGRLAGDGILAGDLESGGVAAGFGGEGFLATAAFAAATALVAGDVGGLEPLALAGLVATLRVAPTVAPARRRHAAAAPASARHEGAAPARPAASGAAAAGGRCRRGAALLALAALRAAAWASPRVAGGLGFAAAAAGSAGGGAAATTSTPRAPTT